jgi:hypothetical protein
MREIKQGLTLGLLAEHTQNLLKELPPETRIFIGSVADDADAWPVRSLETGVFDSERFAIIEFDFRGKRVPRRARGGS